MTATRVATASLVAMVALTCDITDVEGPPADNPDAVPRLTQLTPQDVIVRSLFHVSAGSEMEFMEMMSAAYPDLPFSPGTRTGKPKRLRRSPKTPLKPS